MVYNENTKLAHYKWRESNKDKYREWVNKSVKKHYQENKDSINKKTMARYYLKKEMEAFRMILI